MEIESLHRWDVTPRRAIQIQQRLRSRVRARTDFSNVERVAGVDISVRGGVAHGAVVILTFPDLKPIEKIVDRLPLTFPYVPGLLSFRESPVIMKAFERIDPSPDLIFVDGQGRAHPRRFGIACHLGLLLDLPAIGCGKSRLCGDYEEPGSKEGDFSYLTDHGETIGAVVRTRKGVRPIFVSVGHRIDLQDAIEYTLQCCRGYRLPEPTRLADQTAAEAARLDTEGTEQQVLPPSSQ